jgi:GWxTD domain-containing protein
MTRTSLLRPAFLILFLLFLVAFIATVPPLRASGPLPGQEKVKVKDLAPQYREWLDLTSYIISDKELDVFLHLQNDKDRDVFIQAFWNMRDPTPATPQNEFKEEHLKRFKEADYRFHFGSVRPGWKTDRGRFYIILGPPQSKASIPGTLETYPAEIWSYYGDTDKGMPAHFQLVFFQYKNSGEYKLYDPVSDGPAKLLVNSTGQYAITDFQGLYEKLLKEQPDLAAVALSIVPGEGSINFQPSLQSTMYLAAIIQSPTKGLDLRYATHFLNLRGVVSTEYLTNYMKSESSVAIVFDPETGLAYCDFAITPERLSVDFYEPKREYSTSFLVDVNLRAGEKIILQYSKEYPLTIPEDRMKDTEGMGISIADSFPVVEGKYQLTALLRNTVGKEFTLLERDIDVPAMDGPPRILAPVFGDKTESSPAGAHLPFQAERQKLQVDPKYTFVQSDQVSYVFSVVGLTQELWESGSIRIAIKGSSPTAPPERSFAIPLKGRRFGRSLVFVQSLGAGELPPDYYEMALTLRDGSGNIMDEKSGQFVISPLKALSHPFLASKAFALNNIFMYYYMLAYQHSQVGQADKARAAYAKALELNPGFTGKIPEYAAFLIKEKQYAGAVALVERIKSETRFRFQYALLKGQALAGLERYDEAILSLQEGNQIYNSDAGLLASLGTCYYKTGNMAKALAALKASLQLNMEQAGVKALIQEIEAKK